MKSPRSVRVLGAAVLLLVGMGATARPSRVRAGDGPSQAPAIRVANYSPGHGGRKLKWRPYRPKKPRAVSGVVAAQYVAPAARVPSSPAPRVQSGRQDMASPLNDPFGDVQVPPPVVSRVPSSGMPLDNLVLQEPSPGLELGEMPPEPRTVTLPEADPGLSVPPTGDELRIDMNDFPAESYGETLADAAAPLQKGCRSPDHEDFYTPIGDLTTDTSAAGSDFPPECPLGDEAFGPRMWSQTTFTWKASGLCHKPLYFEDAHLERYGHSWGPYLQPVISGAHFFLTVPVLPYKMGLYPPWECMYTLGYYRPGSCAPYLLDPLPLSVRAGLLQAGAWTGAPYLVP